jgi:hypothetical protein
MTSDENKPVFSLDFLHLNVKFKTLNFCDYGFFIGHIHETTG